MPQYLLDLKNKKAFTIAEMTVVLLILSIVMAAILPVATNKKTGGGSSGGNGSLWKLARNNTDIWFASPNTNQSVLMGTSITPDAGGYGRLYINIPNSTSRSQIAMMYNNNTVGYVKFKSSNNIGLGPNPLTSAITGTDNTSIGQNALISLTSGNHNIGLGNGALRSTTTGGINVALGPEALGKNTTGNYGVGISYRALYNNTTGASNVGIGEQALITNSTGNYNVGVGRYAIGKTTSSDNTGIGHQALYNNAAGVGNTALGAYAGQNNTSGNYSVYIGYQSAASGTKTGHYNVGIGYQSMYTSNISGSNNVGVGTYSLKALTSGGSNTGVGYYAGQSITSGGSNTGVGVYALNAVSSGTGNVGVGNSACAAVTTGNYKSCFGYSSGNASLPAGFSTTDTTTSETIIGNGGGNIYLHAPNVYSGAGNNNTTASHFKVTGDILANAQIKTSTYLETGTYANIGTSANVGSYLTVGTNTYTNYLYTNEIRNRTAPATTNTVIYGTFYGPWTPASDKRLKNIEGFANTGLEEVKKLDVYRYTYKSEPEKQRVGLIAQDVEKVLPSAVTKDKNGYLAISQENIIYTMFNAIKDLDKLYESLKSKFQDYIVRLNLAENRINALIEVNQNLSKRIDELEKRVNKLEKEYTKLEKRQCKCKE